VRLRFGELNLEESGQLDIYFLTPASLLSLLIGSRPGTNGIGMGFYYLPLEVEFPCAPDPPKGHPGAVLIGSGIDEAVRVHMSLDLYFFPSLLMYVYGRLGGLQLERRMM
jgi:hypothetical protein